ncbi:hypothetical protein OPT61_g8932 [Boeremia exigua]|uniref:Uncharacterized protein n=1 Tax=Boeremia exigua TaxID=749465 RepID=A0ACC2HW67_9PLEO|nr:hypothetical protein OPT61_g8932 [Boeremia exigua]
MDACSEAPPPAPSATAAGTKDLDRIAAPAQQSRKSDNGWAWVQPLCFGTDSTRILHLLRMITWCIA